MKNIVSKIKNLVIYQILNRDFNRIKTDVPHFIFLWNKLNLNQRDFISTFLTKSCSQYSQDLFVVSEIQRRYLPKYFVEFGAANGVSWSNTFILEKYFDWTGILAEPGKIWHKTLSENRTCIIDKRCVYSSSGENLEFYETLDSNSSFKVSSPELSTLKKYLNSGDWAQDIRKNNSISYQVETVSLNDLLFQNNAPNHIGYISIDTEGGELQILENFDFSKYKVEIISIEHNSNQIIRKSINRYLSHFGYERVYDDLFGADDIYILNKKE